MTRLQDEDQKDQVAQTTSTKKAIENIQSKQNLKEENNMETIEYRGQTIKVTDLGGVTIYSCHCQGFIFTELDELKIEDKIDSVLGSPFSIQNILGL